MCGVCPLEAVSVAVWLVLGLLALSLDRCRKSAEKSGALFSWLYRLPWGWQVSGEHGSFLIQCVPEKVALSFNCFQLDSQQVNLSLLT